jgi:hypothetical protein
VGYGDKYPRTSAGRVVCALTMFCGIFFLAMPLTIVGRSVPSAPHRPRGARSEGRGLRR